MTLYLLFAGLGILIYASVAVAATAIADFSGAHVPFGLQFAFFASLLVLLAAGILFCESRFLRPHAFTLDRVSAWRGRPSSSLPYTLRAVYANTSLDGGGVEVELSGDERTLGGSL